MATTKRDEAEQNLRGAMRAAMKAGAEVGYDRAVKLAEKIEEGFGEETGIAREMKNLRDRVIADMHASIREGDRMSAPKKFRRVEPDAPARIVMHVDETMFVEGYGYRPVMVVEGEDGYRQNGDWPYEGKKGQKMPWFLGPTIEDAKRQCRERNALAGIDEREAFLIVARSIARGDRR